MYILHILIIVHPLPLDLVAVVVHRRVVLILPFVYHRREELSRLVPVVQLVVDRQLVCRALRGWLLFQGFRVVELVG